MAKKILTQSTVATDNIQSQPDQVTNQASALKKAFDQYGIDSKVYNNNTLLPELQSESVNNAGSNAIGAEGTFGTNNVGDELKAAKVLIDSKLDPGDVYTKSETYNKTEIDNKDTVLQNQINSKANSSDVYLKTETYNQTEVDGIETNLQNQIDLKANDNEVVKLLGTQTITGLKTFENIQVPILPTINNNPASKKYVDDAVFNGVPLGSPSYFLRTNLAGDGVEYVNLPNETDYDLRTADTTAISSQYEKIISSTALKDAPVTDLEIEGATYRNSVENNDFSDGTTGFNAFGGTASIVNGNLVVTGDGSSAVVGVSVETDMSAESGQVIYEACKLLADGSANSISLKIENYGGTGSLNDTVDIVTSPVGGTDYYLNGKYTIGVGITGKVKITILQVFSDSATANGKSFSVNGDYKLFGISMSALGIESLTEAQMLDVVENMQAGTQFQHLSGELRSKDSLGDIKSVLALPQLKKVPAIADKLELKNIDIHFLENDDILALTTGSNNQWVRFQVQSDDISFGSANSNLTTAHLVEGFESENGSISTDLVSSAGKLLFSTTSQFNLVFAGTSTFANLDEAKDYLRGFELIYQLATPIPHEIGSITAYLNGTFEFSDLAPSNFTCDTSDNEASVREALVESVTKVANNSTLVVKNSLIVGTDGWTSSGLSFDFGLYEYTVQDSRVSSLDVINLIPSDSTRDLFNRELFVRTKEYEGYYKIYANKIPSNKTMFDVQLLKG